MSTSIEMAARNRDHAVDAVVEPKRPLGRRKGHPPLSKEFLLKRGYCCHNGCKNCPYREKEMEQKREKWVGWVIGVLAIVFIYLCIEPAMNDTREFIRIMSMVLGGGVASTLIIMWVLGKYLPDQGDSTDPYETWLKENTKKLLDDEDEE